MPHVDRLFRHAMWLERNRAEAEDLVQETLVQALQSFHRFTPGTNCRAWLLSILQHVRANRQRKRGRLVVDSGVDERVANVVPFVPPIPDGVTDEDMLLALRTDSAAPSGGDPALRRGRHDLQGNRGGARYPDRHRDVAPAPGPRIVADGTGTPRRRAGRDGSGKRGALIMQCRDVRELADSFLSEQLLVETNHELLRHLETCPDCRVDIAGRRAIRDRLRAAFARAEDLRPRPEFTAELLATLRPAQPATDISRRSVLQSWWALAAGLAVAAGGGLFVRHSSSRSRLGMLARDAAGDHQNCAVTFNLAERPIPLEDAGRRYGAPYAALADVRAASGRRIAGHAGAAFLCLSGTPIRPRRVSLPWRAHLAARHRRCAACGCRAGAERRWSRRGVATGRTVPRVCRRRPRSSVRPAPGADTRETAVATPRLIDLESTTHMLSRRDAVDRSDAAHRHGRVASRADGQ